MRRLIYLMLLSYISPSIIKTEERSFSIYETPENIRSHGYPAEKHLVTTKDGYILEIHRIPWGIKEVGGLGRPVVFLMHGLLGSSSSYIGIGPKSGAAYNLADAGFDVWMGNARGTRNSRKHVSLNPNDDEQKYKFFNFSFEEIGMIDVATMVDYALKATKRKQLHYVGHSQGGTVFLVLNSMRPKYNKKFKSAHLLAGVGYQKYFPNRKIAGYSILTNFIYNLAVASGTVELYPPNATEIAQHSRSGQKLSYCANEDENYRQVCKMLGVEQLIDLGNDTMSDLHMGGAAIKQVAHFGQNIRDKQFRRWDYGATENQLKYGQTTPPNYNLSSITVNVTMHYTIGDALLDERDVLAMANDMANTKVRKVSKATFTHGDFTAAKDSKELVTDFIIKAIACAEDLTKCPRVKSGSNSNTVVSRLLKTYIVVYILRILHKSLRCL